MPDPIDKKPIIIPDHTFIPEAQSTVKTTSSGSNDHGGTPIKSKLAHAGFAQEAKHAKARHVGARQSLHSKVMEALNNNDINGVTKLFQEFINGHPSPGTFEKKFERFVNAIKDFGLNASDGWNLKSAQDALNALEFIATKVQEAADTGKIVIAPPLQINQLVQNINNARTDILKKSVDVAISSIESGDVEGGTAYLIQLLGVQTEGSKQEGVSRLDLFLGQIDYFMEGVNPGVKKLIQDAVLGSNEE